MWTWTPLFPSYWPQQKKRLSSLNREDRILFNNIACYTILFYAMQGRRMKLADAIRSHTRQKYVLPARAKKVSRFSIRAGDVVRELGIGGHRAPAVCSALKT